jgi:energy-converting hydrogenase Eha subunit A
MVRRVVFSVLLLLVLFLSSFRPAVPGRFSLAVGHFLPRGVIGSGIVTEVR